ncbi:1,4-dihydroxy-2-naphthoate octaprenyltransferase [Kineosphaera limosa]|uniref:Cytochrome c oxidase polypeptide 4 n=1 Tax=Kineosphaera limosa NBRC 100340 TaxID=1184609 RepID=K6WCC8_9MICO|nr:cytochrome c oxidase subunit 4 [Kineosphaera limosa]NYD99045.1 1,4-dihydroxy-2-naphthoate octaprenyltransferase [Kineosphaera limosa]GAB96920.1 cytochrome c oxidase subunit IV [Kineosphaera limosa NBRC 100340]
MKTSAKLFLLGIVFFFPIAVIYGFFTHRVMGQWEPVGVIGIALLGLMSGMVGLYLSATIKKLDNDPADNPEGEIADSAGEYGFFSPHSWWPLALGASAGLVFLALALTHYAGWWLFPVAVVAGAVSLVGWTFEYFRGDVL